MRPTVKPVLESLQAESSSILSLTGWCLCVCRAARILIINPDHLVKEVQWSQSPTSIKDSMEGGNEQSKRIRHPLADVSLEHGERFENLGPISGPAYGSMSMGSYAAKEAYGGQEMHPTVGNNSVPGEPHGI
jgi:hypothetical protein